MMLFPDAAINKQDAKLLGERQRLRTTVAEYSCLEKQNHKSHRSRLVVVRSNSIASKEVRLLHLAWRSQAILITLS